MTTEDFDPFDPGSVTTLEASPPQQQQQPEQQPPAPVAQQQARNGLWAGSFRQVQAELKSGRTVQAYVSEDAYRGNCILILPNPKKDPNKPKDWDFIPCLTRTLDWRQDLKNPMANLTPNGALRWISHKNDGTPLRKRFMGGYWDRFHANLNEIPPERSRNGEVLVMYVNRPLPRNQQQPQSGQAPPQQPLANPAPEDIPF